MARDWRHARRKVERENCCRVCGSVWRIEAAHVIPRSLGGEMKEDSIVPLCRRCHVAYDSRRLDLLSYLHTVEQVEAVRATGSIESARRQLCPSEYPSRIVSVEGV